MTFAETIQIVLAFGSLVSALVAFMMYRQGERRRKDEATARLLTKKQYLYSIAPIIRICKVIGRENNIWLDVESLKPACPALSVCAVAHIPNFGYFVDNAHTSFNDPYSLTLHRDSRNSVDELAASYGVRTLLHDEVERAGKHGIVFVLYSDVDRNGYFTSFEMWDNCGAYEYVFGTEQYAGIDEQSALEKLSR